MENGSKKSMISAGYTDPKEAASEASITIKAMTPAFTDLPIFIPDGRRMAATSGLKIIHANISRYKTVREMA